MKNSVKKVLAVLLATLMLASALSVLAISVSATGTYSDLKRGEFTFAPHTVLDQDLTDYYYYSDSFFSGSALTYNPQLSTMSMILAAASISSQDLDAEYADKSRNLEELFLDLDFWGFDVNSYYRQKPEEQTMGVGMAYRVIGEGENAYTVLAIVPRSAGYQKEWAGNFTVGKTGVHEGFAAGRDIVLEFAKEYVAEYGEGFDGPVKIWTVGYSRGAGVVNLLAASLVDDPVAAIGLEVAQENIFAYTFGTPSTVQYADDTEKAALENDYANIWNTYADYDIVTFAPFKNWNFTYYGKTHMLDVYDAAKKAKMLEFLEATNKTVFDLYTVPGSAADPDNFMAVMLSLTESGVTFAPDTVHNIPNNQRDFLNERIAFLAEYLVPNREVYVDGGYQYALQRLTSLYFGLDHAGGEDLMEGFSQRGLMMVAACYCYFITDCHLNTENVAVLAEVLKGTLLGIEQQLAEMVAADPTVLETDWYLQLNALLTSAEFIALKEQLAATDAATLQSYVPAIRTAVENLAVQMTANVLGDGILALNLEDANEKQELYDTMTSVEVAGPLTRFIVYLLLGTEDTSELTVFDPSNKSLAVAATFIANAGRYMRVHNNEIILSWLRTEDELYLTQPHVHTHSMQFSDTHHGLYCTCGDKLHEEAHTLGDWIVIREATKDEAGMRVKRCSSCSYELYEEIPVLKSSTLKIVLIVVGSTVGGLAVAGGVTFVVLKKRKAKK